MFTRSQKVLAGLCIFLIVFGFWLMAHSGQRIIDARAHLPTQRTELAVVFALAVFAGIGMIVIGAMTLRNLYRRWELQLAFGRAMDEVTPRLS
jgi:hypothetical protein